MKRYWETLDPAPTSNRARPVTVQLQPEGHHTCGWHVYVAEKDEWKHGSYLENNATLQDTMPQWTRLPAVEQKPYLVKAKSIRVAANNQGSALDRALRHSVE